MAAVNRNLPEFPPGNETLAKMQDALKDLVPDAARQEASNNNSTPSDLAKAPELPNKKLKLPSLGSFVRDGLSLAEFGTAFSMVAGSFASQADDIARLNSGADQHSRGEALNFIAKLLQFSTSPLRWLNEALSGTSIRDPNNKTRQNQNVEDFGRINSFNRMVKRLSHHQVIKQFTSLLFNFRRIRFNISPNTFKVPSEEFDKSRITSKPASKFWTYGLSMINGILHPARFFATLAGIATTLPSHVLGLVSSFSGNQEGFEVSKYFKRINNIFTPVIANLSSLFSTTKAFVSSALGDKKEPLRITFGRYNLNFLNVIQGVSSAFISIPHLLGVMAKFTERVTEKNDLKEGHQAKYKISTQIANVFESMGANFQRILPGFNPYLMRDKTNARFDKYVEDYKTFSHNLIKLIFGSESLVGRKLGHLSPYDEDSTDFDDTPYISNDPRQEYIGGIFKKGTMYKDFFEFLHPLQSMLMLLPNAFVAPKDVFIRDNAKRGVRFVDKLLGVSSMVLSAPSYLSYITHTRIPQMILKFYEMKMRKDDQLEDQGLIEKSRTHEEYLGFIDKLENSPIPFATTIASSLKRMNITKTDLMFREEMLSKYNQFDDQALEQEPNVKASELVGAIRIGMRTLLMNPLGQKLFFAQRDPETGLTGAESSRMKIYNWLGGLTEGIGRIPIVGLAARPILESIRKIYYVKPNDNRRVLTRADA